MANFTIVNLDRTWSIEQKVACVLIQRMSKCYPMKSILFLKVLQFVNILVWLLYVLLGQLNMPQALDRNIKSETG